ncbi:DNA polymerase Y family protein [uncultured Microbulbifer sp.]|uniref:Y-family DNA polymerase n=1 Tax=uncultured Microbulbifer sp. TaxID=348147 RepID=UPI00261C5B58|nr:DNA polymerase Y family protein [uncultured Microbulbifer sp.]
MLWLCIQFPKLSLETLTRALTPSERSQALAIVENHILVQPNNAAVEYGISPGLSTSSARIRCPNLQMLQRHKEKEQRQLGALAQWGHSFTPMVSLKAASPEEGSHPPRLYLELSDCLKTHGGLRTLLNQLQQELKEMGISYDLGLGHSPSAALLLSQLAEHRQWLQQTHVPPTAQQWKQWGSQAPCKLLECDKKTIEKLYALGFNRVSHLLAAPLSEVEGLLGRIFINYLARLSGSLRAPISYYPPEPLFDREIFFATPLNAPEQLLLPCNLLLQELFHQFKNRKAYTGQLYLQLQSDKKSISHFQLESSFFSQSEVQKLFAQIKVKIEKSSLDHPIHSLRLHGSQSIPKTLKRLNGSPLESHVLNIENKRQKLIGKLKVRLGKQALSRIILK